MAWISPGATAIETSLSASTAPKRRPSNEARSTASRGEELAEGDIETAFAGNQQFLDLRTAIADGANPIVAVVARRGAFTKKPNPAVNLDGEVGAFGAGFGRMILRHRQFFEIVAA